MLRLTQWTAALLVVAGTTSFAVEPDGREIFERVWRADDSRSHGGDGLGPVFNAKSCTACHDQGGAGGGGAFDKNVNLLTVSLPPIPTKLPPSDTPADPASQEEADDAAIRNLEEAIAAARKMRDEARRRAVALHPDFAESDTIVLHASGVDDEAHRAWRQRTDRVRNQQFLIESFSFDPVVTEPSVSGLEIVSGIDIVGGIDVGDSVPLIIGTNSSSFPVLAELSARIGSLKGKANNGTSLAVPFHGGSLRTSQRNTTALWGAGLIDSIPDAAIEAIAKRQREAKGRVSGRPNRLADGRLGRFGWKGQKSSLHDFTIAACANELGLEVPGAHQATVAYDPEHESKGFDLNAKEVDALVDYLASLPAPAAEKDAESFEQGREVFASIGCAECHVEQVGEVVGLYSDLLLHDLGADLGAVGSYGVPRTPEPDPEDVPIASTEGSRKPALPTSREWRTAPLWGVASSAPYLHDGRAKTIEQAIAFHGGEAAESRLRYMLLGDDQKGALAAFLGALVAPEVAALEREREQPVR